MVVKKETSQKNISVWDGSNTSSYQRVLERKRQKEQDVKTMMGRYQRKGSIPSVDRTNSTASKTTNSASAASHGRGINGIFENSIISQKSITTEERKAFMLELSKKSNAGRTEEECRDDQIYDDEKAVKPLMSRRAYFNQLYKYKMMKENQMKKDSQGREPSDADDQYCKDDTDDKAQWWNIPENSKTESNQFGSRNKSKKSTEKVSYKKTVQFKDHSKTEHPDGPGNSLWNKSLLQIVGEGLFGTGNHNTRAERNAHEPDFPFTEVEVDDFDDCSAVTLDAALRYISGSQK